MQIDSVADDGEPLGGLIPEDRQTVLRLRKALRDFPWALIRVSWYNSGERDLCLAQLSAEEKKRVL